MARARGFSARRRGGCRKRRGELLSTRRGTAGYGTDCHGLPGNATCGCTVGTPSHLASARVSLSLLQLCNRGGGSSLLLLACGNPRQASRDGRQAVSLGLKRSNGQQSRRRSIYRRRAPLLPTLPTLPAACCLLPSGDQKVNMAKGGTRSAAMLHATIGYTKARVRWVGMTGGTEAVTLQRQSGVK